VAKHPPLTGILCFAAASVVANAGQLRDLLPQTHSLWNAPLFSNGDLFISLQSALLRKSDLIQPTGIPPWIALLIELSDLKKEVEDLRRGIVDDIEERLQANGAAAANITPDRLYAHIDKVRASSARPCSSDPVRR
jgi:hypothetical protein